MSDLAIGTWVRRRGQKYHLVESIVAGDAVTACGRRMDRYKPWIRGELYVLDTMPLTRAIGQPQLCRLCYREDGA